MTSTIEMSSQVDDGLPYGEVIFNEQNIIDGVGRTATFCETELDLSGTMFVVLDMGGRPFGNDLKDELVQRGHKPTFRSGRASTYGDGRVAGDTKLIGMPDPYGFDTVLLVDDMKDKGHTQVKTIDHYHRLGIATVGFVVFVNKLHPEAVGPIPTYSAYDMPERHRGKWITGYGADDKRYGEYTRYLRLVAVAKDLSELKG